MRLAGCRQLRNWLGCGADPERKQFPAPGLCRRAQLTDSTMRVVVRPEWQGTAAHHQAAQLRLPVSDHSRKPAVALAALAIRAATASQ